MGVLGNILGRKSNNIQLTDVGQDKYKNYADEGRGTRFDILVFLHDHGKSSVREVAEYIGMDEKNAHSLIESMKREGWVQYA